MSKLTKAAKGTDCTLRLFPYCEWMPETTQPCHLNSDSKGMANKSEDWWLVDGCNTCHAIIDGRMKSNIPPIEIEQAKFRALHETLKRRFDAGLLLIA